VLSLGEQTPKSRWSKVNLGVFPLAPRALTYQFPECRNSDVTRARHLDSTMSPGSHSATSPSGLRGSRNPRLQVLAAGNPECRIPDAPDSCHLSLQDRRSRSNRGIALRDFDVHVILALANPDSPMCDGNGFSVLPEGLTPRSSSPDQRSTRDFGLCSTIQVVDSLPL
jgi:hypothetical protein